MKRYFIVLFICHFTIGIAYSATVTIPSAKDNTIFQGIDPGSLENFEDNSCGAGSNLFSGKTNDDFIRRALLQFDISTAVPAGSTINSVTLTINVDRSGDNQDAPMLLYPLSKFWGEGVANCDPIRGGGQGIGAAIGEATWLDAEFQQVTWSTSGGDYGSSSANALITTRGNGIWDSATNPVMVTDIQNWLDNPGSNWGWIIIGDESRSSTTRRFNSREGSSPPQLTIDFTPVGNVYACCFGDGTCSIQDTISCTDQGGTSFTAFDSCVPNPCPQPQGACCNLDESCTDNVERTTCENAGGSFQGEGSTCSQGSVDCGLEPFVDALPLPAVLQPIGTRSDGVPQYEVTMTEQSQPLHRDLPATDVWTYNGTYPGPTIEAVVGQPIEVKYINSLPSGNQRRGGHLLEIDECAHGPSYWQDTARTVVHLHGGHLSGRMDGHPEHDFLPGGFDVYEYPNNQLPATLWYHDHALGITRLNVYAGLAAFYILRDAFENTLGLPAGEFEIPVVIQDREFNSDGSLFYNPTLQDAFKGNKVVVNGKVWPFLNVKQGKYRFRLLNGSQSREYSLRLENLSNPSQVIPFTLIGTDGGLISAPLSVDTMNMSPAERHDVIIDFSGFAASTEIVLRNDEQTVPLLPNVMKFVVQDQAGFIDPVPATLRQVTPIDPTGIPTRYFRLTKQNATCMNDPDRIIGEWLIESLDGPNGNITGSHWDDITEFPVLGSTEIWEFENPTNMMHPMHVHLVMFQVLDKTSLVNGQSIPLQAWEVNTWKDTVRVPPQSRAKVIMTFEDYPGLFPYHCHILDHEDHEMMRQFQATNDPNNCNLDGVCDAREDCVSCADCGVVSGAFCGNGLCEIGDGEDCNNCSADCAGKAKGKDPYCCGADADCLDPRCTDGYFCRQAIRVAACCGDTLCEGQEDENNCALDCAVASGGGSNCSNILNRDICNADPECQWQGSPRSGTCVPVDSGGCTPTEANEVTCTDGADNDCDGAIDCVDADCSGDPACQTVDCSQYLDKTSCSAQATCQWSNKDKSCINN